MEEEYLVSTPGGQPEQSLPTDRQTPEKLSFKKAVAPIVEWVKDKVGVVFTTKRISTKTAVVIGSLCLVFGFGSGYVVKGCEDSGGGGYDKLCEGDRDSDNCNATTGGDGNDDKVGANLPNPVVEKQNRKTLKTINEALHAPRPTENPVDLKSADDPSLKKLKEIGGKEEVDAEGNPIEKPKPEVNKETSQEKEARELEELIIKED